MQISEQVEVLTAGELMLMPTASTYAANRAPADMRGRYMAIFGLTWGVAQGTGPLAGGFLSDLVGPSAPWLMGGFTGSVAAAAFMVLASLEKKREADITLAPEG